MMKKKLSRRRKERKQTKKGEAILPSREKIDQLAYLLSQQIDAEIFQKKYAPVADVLKLVGAGAFLAASIAVPNLPRVLKPLLTNPDENESWKRFNIHYLKRTFARLEKQKLVEKGEEDGREVVRITDHGRRRILKYALDELTIEKPKRWDGKWRLVSYDLPESLQRVRNIFRTYLSSWGFYPLHESVFLHAYPCLSEVEFLREYLGIGEYVRMFQVAAIERDEVFRDFFGV